MSYVSTLFVNGWHGCRISQYGRNLKVRLFDLSESWCFEPLVGLHANLFHVQTLSRLHSTTAGQLHRLQKNHFDQTNMNIQWSSGLVLALSLPPPHQSPVKLSDLSDSSPRTDESHANSRFRLITIHTTLLWFLQCTMVWVLQLIRCPSGTSRLVGVHCYSLRHCLCRSAMCASSCLLKL